MVNVGKFVDGRLKLIQDVNDLSIKIIKCVWDESLKNDGQIFGIEQKFAWSLYPWDGAFLVQGDEGVHEEYLPTVHHVIEPSNAELCIPGFVLQNSVVSEEITD